jgi:hypothetical protein
LKKYFFLLLFIPFTLVAQKKDSAPLDLEDYVLVKRGDTLTINLDELTILPKLNFNSPTDTRYYYWFKRKVFKAYPYAKTASQRLDSLNSRLKRIKTK